MLIGNAPIIVDKLDGSVHVTGTSRLIEEYIEEYRRRRGTTAPGFTDIR